MELIKKIKQAEAEAQEIIDKAKADTINQAEQGRQKRREAMAAAEQERRKAVDSAVAKARSQGQAEVAKLKADSQGQKQQLQDQTKTKMAAAVEKVVAYLKG